MATQPPPPTRVVIVDDETQRKRFSKRNHHYRKHHRSHHPGSSGCLFWGFIIFFLLLLFGWLIASFWIWPDNGQVVIVDNDRFNHSVFVFRKRHSFSEKRSKREECRIGEVWNADLKLCAPIFNSPTAFDGTIMNTSIPSCTSFFGNMCGKWNAEHINEDRTFSFGYHRNQRILEKLISSATPADPISQFYQSCIGVGNVTNARETIIEMKHLLEVIVGDLNTYGDLPVIFGRLARHGYTAPFVFSIERHPTEPRMIPFISWDGFPGLDEQLVTSVFQQTRYITLFTSGQLGNKIERVVKMGKLFNQKNTEPLDDITDYTTYVKNYLHEDLITYDQLPAWNMPPLNTSKGWNSYLQSLDGMGLRFSPKQTVWVVGLPYLEWLLQEALYQFDLNDWRAYIQFSILYNGRQFNPSLPNNVYFRKWDIIGPTGRESRIYHRIPRGNMSAPSNAQCVEITQHMIPGLVADAYLKNMPQKENTRTEIKAMTRRILDSYADLINDTSWLPPVAKNIAIDKIRNVLVRVAEPDEWEVEPFASRLSADRYDHNMNMVRRYRVHRNLQLWHKDIPTILDRNAMAFFSGPLSDVNAYYSGPTNSITILAGILQPPFYSMSYNNVSKHAIIGSIIGHELGHLLDYHGIFWDKNGSLVVDGIWPRIVMSEFKRRLKCVEEEFALNREDCPGLDVDFNYGNITLNEDAADLTGVRLSYMSYFEKTPEGKASSRGDKQHFFMVFAQAWCSSYTREVKCAHLDEDPHAVAEYRVDRTLRNLRQFHQAFSCSGSNPMFRENCCVIYGNNY